MPQVRACGSSSVTRYTAPRPIIGTVPPVSDPFESIFGLLRDIGSGGVLRPYSLGR